MLDEAYPERATGHPGAGRGSAQPPTVRPADRCPCSGTRAGPIGPGSSGRSMVGWLSSSGPVGPDLVPAAGWHRVGITRTVPGRHRGRDGA